MSLATINVETQSVSDFSQQLKTRATNIREHLHKLDGNVKYLLHEWDGEAKRHYHAVQLKWQNNLDELDDLLESISDSTKEIAQNYVTTDDQSAQLFK